MFLRKIFSIIFVSAFIIFVLVYGFYKALPLILGPSVAVSTPIEGELVAGDIIEVSGSVVRSKKLFINNIPTAFTEDGLFNTRIPVFKGHNIIVVEVQDKFGRNFSLTRNIGTKN